MQTRHTKDMNCCTDNLEHWLWECPTMLAARLEIYGGNRLALGVLMES